MALTLFSNLTLALLDFGGETSAKRSSSDRNLFRPVEPFFVERDAWGSVWISSPYLAPLALTVADSFAAGRSGVRLPD